MKTTEQKKTEVKRPAQNPMKVAIQKHAAERKIAPNRGPGVGVGSL